MAKIPHLPADAHAIAQAALHSGHLATWARGWWDFALAAAVIILTKFFAVLPQLVSAAGLIVMALTILEKLIALGWIKNPRRTKQGESDETG